MKKLLMLLIMVTILVACNDNNESKSADQDENAKQKIKFVLDWTPNTNHTGIYVAQKKGYFNDKDWTWKL